MIIVNDEERPLEAGMTVHDLLVDLDPQLPMCVVKIGGAHVPRSTWEERELQEGEEVRVVYIIAGG